MRDNQNEGCVPSHTGEDHHAIQRHFRSFRPTNQGHKSIATQLNRLYDLRRIANYKDSLGSRRPVSLAEQAIGIASTIRQNLQSLVEP